MGAVASSFVGTLYGYSYLKGDIDEWWKESAATKQEADDYHNMVQTAYFAGFFGQYLAIIPGLCYDYFGGAVTCWYGGGLCMTGFILVGVAAKTVKPAILVLGIFLAGQGSKGLGFGTLLGTIRAVPDTWATAISGIYLMLDAMSSVFCMSAYDGIYGQGKEAKEMDQIAEDLQSFFVLLACVIGGIGLVAGFTYYFVQKNAEAEAAAATEAEQERNVVQAVATGSGRRLSESSRRSSIVDGAALDSKFSVDGNQEQEKDIEEAQPLVSGETKAKPTFWGGVICCFIVMTICESQGLAYNNNIGDAYMAAVRSEVGMITWDRLKPGMQEYPSLRADIADEAVIRSANAGDNLETAVAFRQLVEESFTKIPKVLAITPSKDKLTFSPPSSESTYSNVVTDSFNAALTREFPLPEALKCCQVLLEGCKGAQATYKVHHFVVKGDSTDSLEHDRNLFRLIYEEECNFADTEAATMIRDKSSKLSPLAGLQVKDKKVLLVAHNHGWGKGNDKHDVSLNNEVVPHSKVGDGRVDLGTNDDGKPVLYKLYKKNTIHAAKQKKLVAEGEDVSDLKGQKGFNGKNDKGDLKLHGFIYTTFANSFGKYIHSLQKTGDSSKPTVKPVFNHDNVLPSSSSWHKVDREFTVSSGSSKIFYNPQKLSKSVNGVSHDKQMKSSKKMLAITFSLGNAFGRLGTKMLLIQLSTA